MTFTNTASKPSIPVADYKRCEWFYPEVPVEDKNEKRFCIGFWILLHFIYVRWKSWTRYTTVYHLKCNHVKFTWLYSSSVFHFLALMCSSQPVPVAVMPRWFAHNRTPEPEKSQLEKEIVENKVHVMRTRVPFATDENAPQPRGKPPHGKQVCFTSSL